MGNRPRLSFGGSTGPGTHPTADSDLCLPLAARLEGEGHDGQLASQTLLEALALLGSRPAAPAGAHGGAPEPPALQSLLEASSLEPPVLSVSPTNLAASSSAFGSALPPAAHPRFAHTAGAVPVDSVAEIHSYTPPVSTAAASGFAAGSSGASPESQAAPARAALWQPSAGGAGNGIEAFYSPFHSHSTAPSAGGISSVLSSAHSSAENSRHIAAGVNSAGVVAPRYSSSGSESGDGLGAASLTLLLARSGSSSSSGASASAGGSTCTASGALLQPRRDSASTASLVEASYGSGLVACRAVSGSSVEGLAAALVRSDSSSSGAQSIAIMAV